MSDDFFAPPAFKPQDALVTLKRQLRDLKLAERGAGFELKGQQVVELRATDSTIEAKLVKRPQRTPEWTAHTLKASPDVRKFVELVKQHLARWSDAE
jgi:hypothetical protein